MKPMIIPIAIGLLAGLGGGSGYAYMKASAKYVKDSTHVADSLKAHPPADSTESAEHADSSHAPAVDSAGGNHSGGGKDGEGGGWAHEGGEAGLGWKR